MEHHTVSLHLVKMVVLLVVYLQSSAVATAAVLEEKFDPCSVIGHVMCIHVLDVGDYIVPIGDIWGLSGI